ncbi:hypothetical protein PUN28_017369 [Cardiocondyla obscurior]|uniref:Ribosomal protein S14 n=1 Tax=Cardiocondyla obscurior TaxID=286306 RepID=A0AAW2ELH2_9HYME
MNRNITTNVITLKLGNDSSFRGIILFLSYKECYIIFHIAEFLSRVASNTRNKFVRICRVVHRAFDRSRGIGRCSLNRKCIRRCAFSRHGWILIN